MTKLESLINELCPNGVEYKHLWELTAWDKKFNSVDRSKQYKIINYHYFLAGDLKNIVKENGKIKILTTNVSDLWTDQELVRDYISSGEIVCLPWGGNPIIQYFKGDFVTADNRIATSLDTSVLSNKFLYYVLLNALDLISSYYRGSGIKHPDMSKVLELEIPVPPRPVQDEIVRILDKMTDLTTELTKSLTTELDDRKKQYEYYRDRLFTFDDYVNFVTIGECFKTVTDYTAAGSFADVAKNVVYKNEESFAQLVRTMDIKSNFTKGNPVYIDENAFNYLWRVNFDKDCIILPNIGANCGEVYFIKQGTLPYKNNALGPNAIMLKDSNCNIKYLFYLFLHNSFQNELKKIISPGGQTKFNKTDLKGIKIILPLLEEQERIVSILDKFDKYCNDLSEGLPAEIELRQKQYEYYRDKLLTFKRLNA